MIIEKEKIETRIFKASSESISDLGSDSDSEPEPEFKNCKYNDESDEYYDSDNSDIVYKKATKNTAKRAINIINNSN